MRNNAELRNVQFAVHRSNYCKLPGLVDCSSLAAIQMSKLQSPTCRLGHCLAVRPFAI